MPGQFKRPLYTARGRDYFSDREVGLNHPDNPSFIKINDAGMIEIIGGDNFGIVMDPKTRTINFFADSVKFFVKDIRWNKLAFNNKSTKYTEPTLVEQSTDTMHLLFNGVQTIVES